MIPGVTSQPLVDPLHAPFHATARPELTGGHRVGVLLSHGFTGSPYSVRPWGEALAGRGYGVAVPRLPGHGTTWQDLNTRRFEDWYAEVDRALTALRAEHDAVVVGGLSMGGTLALRLAAERPDDVAGVVVVNPAVSSTRLDVKLLPVLKRVVPSFPAIAGDIKKPGTAEHGYDRTPLRALHSFMQAWGPTVAALPRVTAPLLYLRSTVDHVVDDSSTPLILDGVSSTDVTRVDLADSYHVATLDHDAPAIARESAAFVARVTGADLSDGSAG